MVLWNEEAGFYWIDDSYNCIGDCDDATDNTILLWCGIFNFGGCEFTNIANFAVCDGADVYDWCGGRDSGNEFCGGVGCKAFTGFSYRGGRVVCRDAGVFSRDAEISMVGVFHIRSDCDGIYDLICSKKKEKKKKYGKI